MSDLSPLCAPKRTPADHSEFTGSRLDDEVKRGCDRTHAGLSERGWAKRVGWMERLVRRSPDGAQRNPGPRRVIPGFRCAPSGLRHYVLNLDWSFAASVYAKTDGVDNKTGSSDLPVGRVLDRAVESFISDFPKNICCHLTKSNLELSHPTPPEGRIMIVTDAGRDAVDAAAFCARRDCRAS